MRLARTPIITRGTRSCFTAAENTKNYARKPPVGGSPARERRKIEKVAPIQGYLKPIPA